MCRSRLLILVVWYSDHCSIRTSRSSQIMFSTLLLANGVCKSQSFQIFLVPFEPRDALDQGLSALSKIKWLSTAQCHIKDSLRTTATTWQYNILQANTWLFSPQEYLRKWSRIISRIFSDDCQGIYLDIKHKCELNITTTIFQWHLVRIAPFGFWCNLKPSSGQIWWKNQHRKSYWNGNGYFGFQKV